MKGVHRDLEELAPEQGRRPGGWRFRRGGARPMRWEELPPGQGRGRGEHGRASPLRLGPCDEERSHRGLRMRPPEGGEGLPEGRCHAGMRGRGGRRSGGWSSVCRRREGRSSARADGARVLGQHEWGLGGRFGFPPQIGGFSRDPIGAAFFCLSPSI